MLTKSLERLSEKTINRLIFAVFLTASQKTVEKFIETWYNEPINIHN